MILHGLRLFGTLLLLLTGIRLFEGDVATIPSTKGDGVSFNKRSFILNGKPLLLLSGSIHYTRIPRSDWHSVLNMANELGLNCIETYVFWNFHEPTRGHVSWKDQRDLIHFLQLAQDNGLYVNLRIGPYACGEYYFGGLPLWIRTLDDIECLRCFDPIWKREMQTWTEQVVEKVQPLLYPNGGPIVLMQIENEYGQYDDYAQWAVDMARNITTDIPWEMCHSVPACTQLNQDAGYNKVLCAINGFWMDQGGKGNQPGPEFFDTLWNGTSTNQPAIWTEDQGWFDRWGDGQRIRLTSDQAYGMARFFAYGGSFHNFYMLTGGNNYERRAGGDVTTAYAHDTAIDNLLLRHNGRFSVYQRLFKVLREYEKELLSHPPARPIPLERLLEKENDGWPSNAEVHEYGRLVFLSNMNEHQNGSGIYVYNDQHYFLTNHSVVVVDVSSSLILFNTTPAPRSETSLPTDNNKKGHGSEDTISISRWKYFQETVGYGSIRHAPRKSPEQLNITNNDSDYLWYSFWIEEASGRIVTDASIHAYGFGGLQYIYVDGKLLVKRHNAGSNASSSNMPKPSMPVKPQTTTSARKLNGLDNGITAREGITKGQHRYKIDILSVAMGLSNGNIGIQSSTKGIQNVTIITKASNSATNLPNSNTIYDTFATQWMLRGEELEIYTHEGSKAVDWKPVASSTYIKQKDSLIWFQGMFDLPIQYHSYVVEGGNQQPQPDQTALVANLTGLHKGVAYINGFNIGRYWLIKGSQCKDGDCAPPRHGRCHIYWNHCGQPTQSLYHIPFELLKRRDNIITLFEETAATRNFNDVSIQIIRSHQ